MTGKDGSACRRFARHWVALGAALGVAGGAGLVAAYDPAWAVGIGTAAAVFAAAVGVLRR
jgi:triosephosphate isomerase